MIYITLVQNRKSQLSEYVYPQRVIGGFLPVAGKPACGGQACLWRASLLKDCLPAVPVA